MNTPSSPKVDHTKEVRFAVVMYGGVSLAIYINGIAQELLSLVRSTAEAYEDDAGNRSLSGVPVQPDDDAVARAQKLRGTERAYRKLSYLLSDADLLRRYKESLTAQPKSQFTQTADMLDEYLVKGKGKGPERITTGFIVDILSGTSAGGINAIFLAKALANNQSIEKLKQLWVQEGDIGLLINDKQSLAGLALQNQDPPKSLLNSRRMYLQLLKAFDGMDATKPIKPNYQSPYVQELDLFVTTTDLKGTVVPLQLCDKLVYEKRHRNVFHLKYGTRQEFGSECNQFVRKYNPFLAFAARCTSSFPFAFEPMRLSDLDPLLTSFGDPDYKNDGGSESELWKPFFRENIDVVFADDGKRGAGTLDFTSRVKKRSYADGGYLDNKPFSYATESLSHRQSIVPVERKLIYIEPSPEHPEDEAQSDTPPNVLLNAKAALIDLPTYETIREDLQRVLQRNRTFQRIARIVEATKQDIEKTGRGDRRYDVKPRQWRLMDMQMMVEYRGIYFLPYRRLRIASVTDDLTSVIAKVKNLDERSDQFIAVRGLLRALRDKQYVENYSPENAQLVREILANNISPDAKPTESTQNAFLDEFDYSYRFRRLNFVLEKIDFLTQLAVQDLPAADESDYVKQARAIINRAGRKESVEVLSYLKSELTEVHKTLRTGVRRLQAGPEAIAELQRHPPPPLNRLLKPELHQAIVDFYKTFDNLKLDEKQLKFVLGVPGQVSNDGFITLTSANYEQFARLDENTVNRRANDLYEKDATLKSLLDGIANKFKATLRDLIIRPTSDYCAQLLDPGKPLPDAVSNAQLDKSSGDEIPKLSQEIVRGYLYDFYVNFDDYDQILFPILYQTEFGESAAVDVFRISPEDAPSLINERGQNADGRQKLAGTALFHFGAFLDRVWRENDIMWGRLDGAERLITALLPDPEYQVVRDKLISDAHVAILLEEMPSETRLALSGLLSDALIRASSGEPFEEVLIKVVGPLTTPRVKQKLATAMRACLEDEQLLDFVKEHYEVNRELEPKPLLRSVARATQVTGKIFDDIAKANRVDSKSIRWIARAGQLFWGLVEVAVPGSIANLVFQHGLKLIYMFEFLLVLFGTVFASPSVQQIGWLTLAITVTVHTAQLVLSDTLRGKHWWRYLIIGPAALFVLTVVGFGIAAFIGIFYDPTAWRALTRIQEWSASLTPPGRKAVKIGLLIAVGAFVLGAFWTAMRARMRTRLLGVLPLLLGLLIAGGTIYAFAISKRFSEALPGGLHVPGLAIQMSRDPAEVEKIEKIVGNSETDAQPGIEKLRKNVTEDFPFIGLYTVVFLTFSYWLSRRRFDTAVGLAIAAAVLAIAAAAFDVLENVRLYAVLDSLTPDALLLQKLHQATLLKWTLCFITTGVLSVLFLSRKDNAYLLGLGLLIVSLLGILGLFTYPLLEFAFIALGAIQFLIGLFIVIFPDRFRADTAAPELP